MRFGNTIIQPASGDVAGKAAFSALREAWAGFSSANRTTGQANLTTLQRDLDKQNCPPELYGIIDSLKAIRQRIVTNTLLAGWTEWSICILIGLVVAGTVSSHLNIVLALALLLAVIGVAAITVWIWRNRLSTYETACRLDGAAGLQDRVSTAIFLSDSRDPLGMIQQQRKDAVARVAKVDSRALFPLQMPATAVHALVLLLVFGGLFVYRINHRAPLVSLLRSTARSSLVQSIFTPIVHAMEKDLERTIALVTLKPELQPDEVRPGEALPVADDLWQPAEEKAPDTKDAEPQEMADEHGDQQGQPKGQGNPNAMPPSDEQQQQGDPNGQPQEGKQSDAQGQQSNQQSLTKAMMDALKKMMSNPKDQQKGNQQQNPQNMQQGGAQPPGATESDKKGDSKGSSDQKQNASKSAGSGAGSQEGTKEMLKGQPAKPVNAVPDRVALEASGYKEQTRMRVDTETGTAHMATQGASPQTEAVINGAEQENIPARYRLYVQRYFEHADSGSH